MLKLLGCVLIFGGCTLMGFESARRLRRQAHIIKEFAGCLSVIERELALNRPPMPELLRTASMGADAEIKRVFTDWSQKLEKGKSFTDICGEGLDKLGIMGWARTLLSGLGQVLGRYDDLGQEQAVAGLRRELESLAAQMHRDSTDRGRAYRVLGMSAGGVLVLMLL